MTTAADLRSGKDHRGENFPVASMLIAARYRKPIMAFYDFVRVADDVADHPSLTPADKLKLLDSLEATLLGKSDAEPQGVALRNEIETRGLTPAARARPAQSLPHGRHQVALCQLGRAD